MSRWFWILFAAYVLLALGFVATISGGAAAWSRSLANLSPDEQTAAVAKFQQFALFSGGGLMLALVGVTWFCLHQVVQPLRDLTRSVRESATSDNVQPLTADSRHEIGHLAGSFNQLQRKLASRLQEAQESAQRLKAVLGSMAEGVLAVGPDNTILFANEAGRRLLDIPTIDPVGRLLLEATRSRSIAETVPEALAAPGPVEREFEAPGSQRRYLSLRASRLPGDPCPGVLLVLRDLSELRRLENLRRELVANVSHELKTPLASIKAFAETLQLGAIDDPDHNRVFVARIEEQAERLHQLILDMIQIARVEAGQESFEITDVPLADVFDECAAQFREAAAARRITLSIERPDEVITVRSDEEGVRTILNNLIDNAIKYTPEAGQIVVRCRVAQEAVTLEVQDTGIGIAEKDQGRVFERFFRVDKARSREMGGTGLGLSIVKHLAHAFGGSVGLESQLRKGSTFLVRLPRGKPRAVVIAS
jgi:two-component system phosphate regulon sensor histidine kinase PhoR